MLSEVCQLVGICQHVVHFDVFRMLEGEVVVSGVKLTVETIDRRIEAANAYESVVRSVLDMTCQWIVVRQRTPHFAIDSPIMS